MNILQKMNDIHLNKLPSDSGSFLILTRWKTDFVEFNIYEILSNNTFKGKLDFLEMEEIAKELEIPFKDFVEECRKAVTTHLGLPQYKYDINVEQQQFTVIKKNTFTTIQYLDIKLTEDTNLISKMLETAVDVINIQNTKNSEMIELKTKAEKHYEEISKFYELCLEEKNKLESKLLKKFTLLLNSKKDKIAELLMAKANELDENENDNNDDDDDANAVMEILNTKPSTSNKTSINQVKDTTTTKRNVRDYEISDDEDIFSVSTELMTQPVKKRRKTNDEEGDINHETSNESAPETNDSNYESD